jgi:hypothetical protein
MPGKRDDNMKIMKRFFQILTLFLLISIPDLFAQFEGTLGIGAHASYGTEINRPGIGGHLHYYHTNNLRFAPSFTYFPEIKDKGMWMIDADAHYVLPVSITASLYPIGGIHYSNWLFDETTEMPRTTKHRLGTNLGMGFQHDISYRVRANFELKYQFIRDYSQVMLSAGFGFWF